MVSDPIADFIIRIKNAGAVKKQMVNIPYSKLKEAIANLLKSEGYLAFVNVKGKNQKKSLEIGLLYDEVGKPRITNAHRVSRPSRRIYKSFKEIRPVKFGHGLMLLSTPKGVITGKEAQKKKVGGEALLKIY